MNLKSEHRYDDILYLPHHVSTIHPQMDLQERAAQFSPFAALTGYEGAIKEAARLTDEYKNLEEDSKEILDTRLQIIKEYLIREPLNKISVTIVYFKPDENKAGGTYITTTGFIKKIDEYEHKIILEEETVIPIDSINDIESSLFNDIDE